MLNRKLIGAAVMLVAVVLSTTTKADTPTSHMSYQGVKSGKGYFHMVFVDLSADNLKVETTHSKKLQNFWKFTQEEMPVVAITGTFFDPASANPVGDVLIDGALVAKGERGSAFAVDWKGRCKVFDTGFHQEVNWLDYRYALRGTVRIIRDGKVCPDPKSQKFRDSSIWNPARRTAVGVTKKGSVVFCATSNSVTLSELGRAMKSVGVINAVNLDGGGSSCLMYKGKLLVAPQRKLSNLLMVKAESRYLGQPGIVSMSAWTRSR